MYVIITIILLLPARARARQCGTRDYYITAVLLHTRIFSFCILLYTYTEYYATLLYRARTTRTMGTRPADKNLWVPTGADATARATSIILYTHTHTYIYLFRAFNTCTYAHTLI